MVCDEGLKAGDKVVVEGFQKFAAGDKVRPLPGPRRMRRPMRRGLEADHASAPVMADAKLLH